MFHRFLLLMLAVQMAFATTVNYSYDAGGRLIRIDYGLAGSINYTYDASGNLLSRTVLPATTNGGTITSVNTSGSPASAGIAANTWIEIKGTDLVPASTPAAGVIWSSAPDFAQGRMPTNLNGISVTVNGNPAYVYFFCSAATDPGCGVDQVNALTPLAPLSNTAQIVVSNNQMPSSTFTATAKSVAPSFLLFNAQGYVAATHANNSLLGPATLYPGLSTPAAAGEPVVLYAVGFGPPTAPLTEGSSRQSGSLATLPVCTLGANQAQVLFAGVISPGLYQLNITVPTSQPSGDSALSCTYSGSSTQSGVLLSVK
jgi:uncharacterized protein (TIGR03437 family)